MDNILANQDLSPLMKGQVTELLERRNPSIRDDLKQMWFLMDLVWDDFRCDNKKNDLLRMGEFYSHPVWLLNGLFIGELRDKTPMKYYLYRDNLFISKKVLRIFGIGKYGEDYTVKEIEIVFSCNIVDDEYVTIKVETLVG